METAFLAELEKEYSELLTTGKIKSIEEIKSLTSKQFSYSSPQYYSGNISSKLVVVTFNSNREYLCREKPTQDFESYKVGSKLLGDLFLNDNCINDIESSYPVDIRMLNYFKPFNVIRFEQDSIKKNLKRLTDEKFEISLIPFLSPDFSEKDFMTNYKICKPFVDRILEGIVACQRQYIVFLGSCFNNILSDYIEESESFRFLLTTPNCPNQKFVGHFTRVTVKYENRRFIAGIAESFCNEDFESILLEKYGQESVAIINRGLLLSKPLWSANALMNS